MSDDRAADASEPQAEDNLSPAMHETLASLLRRMELIEREQRERSHSIDRTILHLGELTERVQALHGTVLRLDRWIDMLIHDVDGARTIVMQAEHQMQQGVAAINERLLDLTSDVHRLHLIRETPEYKISALKGELATVQQRLIAIESSKDTSAG